MRKKLVVEKGLKYERLVIIKETKTHMLYGRIRRGWEIKDAIEIPKKV